MTGKGDLTRAVLGHRRPIGMGSEEGAPDVTDVVADVFGNGVVLEDVDGLSDAVGEPSIYAADG